MIENNINKNMNELYILIKENINNQFSNNSILKIIIVYNRLFTKVLKDINAEIADLSFDKVQLDLYYSDLLEKYKIIIENLQNNLKNNVFNKKVFKRIIILFLVVYNCYLEDNKKYNELLDMENLDDYIENNDNIKEINNFIKKKLNLN